MTEVVVNKTIQVPAVKAWETLSSFRNIEAISAIVRSETTGEGTGAKRTCYLEDGSAIYEVLNSSENSAMEMQYSILESPFPVSDYVSDIKIEAVGDMSSKITWGSQFETDESLKNKMTDFFGGFYNDVIQRLELMHQN